MIEASWYLLFVALRTLSLLRGIFLQRGGDVSQIVEYSEGVVDVLRYCTVNHQIEDVELTGFRLYIPTQGLGSGQASVYRVRQGVRPGLGKDLSLGRAVIAGVSNATILT